GLLAITAGIAYVLWPSPTPSTTRVVPGPVAPSDPMTAAEPPKNLDEIIKEAPKQKELESGPPPPGRPDFGVPKFNEPGNVRGPRGGPNLPGLPGGPPDRAKSAVPAPRFFPVEPLPISPTPMATDRVERTMPGPIENMVVAGGGRLLLLLLPRDRRVVVFDVNKGERVKLIPAEDDGVMVAGGMNLFVIYLPGKRVLERWSCKTLEREAEFRDAFPAEVKALAMGSASNGPLVAALGGGRRTVHGGTTLGYFDPSTGKEVGYEIGGARNAMGVGLLNATAIVRVSADGSVVTAWGDNGHGGSQSDVIDGARITRYWQFGWLDSLIPGPDGRTLYGKGLRYPPDLRAAGNPRENPNNSGWLIPAVQGEYFLSVRSQQAARGARFDAARKTTADILVGADGKSILNIGELPNFELPGGRGKTFDQFLALIPEAKVLAIVPTKNRDRLTLIRADLDSALSKAEFDYLFVTSRPPTTAVKGEAYKYTVVTKSKKGGIKVTLESGPKGMAVTPAGVVTWDVPKNFAESEVGVILKVGDAGGKELFHSFRVAVRSKAEKKTPDPKGN
ncbi:MAG: hypothetical protein J2P46_20975, partial [Zavarzinella sp.]|nr:hypothetical protein [Zavarzinella sp.]